MLPTLVLNASTVDHFRKNVYRPRLCLLLLLILLSPYNTSQLTSSADTEVSVSQPASQGWSVSIIDGLVIAAPPPVAKLLSPPSTPPESVSKPEANNAVTAAKRRESKASPSPAPVASSSSSSQPTQPPPGSLFRLPRLSWGLLIDTYVLPAILPLHLLWAIRLMGMAIEDGVVKTSLMGSKSHFRSNALPALYLALLACLALVIGHPFSVQLLKDHCEGWRSQFGFETALDDAQDQQRSQALLPLKLIVILEAGACLVALLSASFKVQETPLARMLPVQIKLPSPSHAPSLIDLLPLPASMRAGLSGAAQAPPPAYTSRRRPMMPSLVPRADTAFQGPGPEIGAPGSSPSGVSRPTAPLQMPEEPSETSPSDRPSSTSAPLSPPTSNDSTYYASSSYRRRRAPRMQGQSVVVSTRWLLETIVSLFDKAIGAALYAIVTLRLPTLSPTSLPPVLSLLSLRSELVSLTSVWTKARNSVECLEFVRRRWGVRLTEGQDPYKSVHKPRAVAAAASGDYRWKSHDDVYCAICFELTRPAIQHKSDAEKDSEAHSASQASDTPDQHEFCRLDCGHELHEICLVSWLTAQAFCPTCHVVLSFSPRSLSTPQQQQS